MKLLRYFLYLVLGLALLFGLFLLFSTIVDYKPEERIIIDESSMPDTLSINDSLCILTWNIGYCGLGKEMDFFYDGGEKIRDSKKSTNNNLSSISKFLVSNDTVDIFLLQEVDIRSKRTYHINEVSEIADVLDYPNHYFAPNFKVLFLPVPPSEPVGLVHSGLLTVSKIKPYMVERFDFPGSYPWPKNLFMLDRCFLVSRIALSNHKDLLIINTHNSAFDGGTLKKHEMEYLKDFVENEYSNGNYILVAGDWNQNPPGFDGSSFNKNSEYQNFELANIPADFLPNGWTWIYDKTYPSNRSLSAPYKHGETATTILDFFLCSPNIKTSSARTINLNFENSDHQPVLTSIKFK